MNTNHKSLAVLIGMFTLILIVLLLSITTNQTNAQSSQFITITETTESDEDDFKELFAFCPDGMQAISGGAGIFYSSSEGVYLLPVLISSFMYRDNQSWFAEAVQPKVATTEWRLQVHVTCVDE